MFFWDRHDSRDTSPDEILRALGPSARRATYELHLPDPLKTSGAAMPVEDAAEWLAPIALRNPAGRGSVGFWAVASRVGLELVAQGKVLPVAEHGRSSDAITLRWMPALTTPDDRVRRMHLVRSMPGAARATEPARSPARVLDAFWDALVDSLMRRSYTSLPRTYGWEADFVDHLGAAPGTQWYIDPPNVREGLLEWLTTPPDPETWIGIARLLAPSGRDGRWVLSLGAVSGEDPEIEVEEADIEESGGPSQRAALEASRARICEILGVREVPRTLDLEAASLIAEATLTSHGADVAEGEGGPRELPGETLILLPPEIQSRGRAGIHARLRADQGTGPWTEPGSDHEVPHGRAPLLAELESIALSWELALGERALTSDEISMLVSARRPLVHLNGTWLLVPHEFRSELTELLSEPPPRLGPAEVVAAALGGRLAQLGAESVPVSLSRDVARIVELIRGDRLTGVVAPADFTGELRHYQERGLEWLQRLEERHLGGCLADDMGLGKTVQAIALFLANRTPTLVVCPTSVLGNWERELRRFAPSLRPLRHHGPERARDVAELASVVDDGTVAFTTYALLRRDVALLAGIPWGRVVLDEAQHAKNPASETARAARQVSEGARSRLALTGTPVENTLEELWSVLDFTNPGLLGSRSAFKQKFVIPVENGDVDLAHALRLATGPFVLRRRKSDPSVVSDLPPKHETVLFCDLTEEQRALYTATVRDGMAGVSAASGIGRRGLVLAMLTRLKQICDHPALALAGDGTAPSTSGKLELLLDMVADVTAAGDRCLVFTQFVQMGRILAAELDAPFLHGGLTGNARDRLVDGFQDDNGPAALVVSLRAGGQGLNLTAANRVFHYDRWWNPAVEDQASDRAHRIGQTRDVWVHKLICMGTVEERIDAVLERKRSLADDVVAHGEAWATDLGDEELARLVELEAM